MTTWVLLFSFVILATAAPRKDPEEVLNLFEGDIELLPESGFRSVINEQKKLWPNGRVPYEIDNQNGDISDEQLRNISIAIQNFHDNTCLRFVEKTSTDRFFIQFRKVGSGCSSNVGMVNTEAITGHRGQIIRLSDFCFQVGKITHEMMHSLGFFHEQSRFDRDKFVKIIPQNIEQGKMMQFRQHDLSKQNINLGAPYDYGSLMHYPNLAFSQDGELESIVPIYEGEIGQRRAMSAVDIWKINKLYNCPNVGPAPKVEYKEKVGDAKNVKLPKATRYFHCTFEFHWTCGMRDEMESDFDWEVAQGQKSKYLETGPKLASDGEECCYIYMNTIAKPPGERSSIVTPILEKTDDEGSCFSFYYHMYGSTIGSLNVFWKQIDSDEKNIILSEQGNHGDKWIKKSVIIKSDKDFEVFFRGTVGGDKYNSYEGNIALDRIEFRPMQRLIRKGEKCE